MKKYAAHIFFLSFVFFFTACQSDTGDNSSNEAVSVNKALQKGSTKLPVDTELSQVLWRGRKIVADGNRHRGTVDLSEGTLLVKDGNLVGGDFTIDMATLKATDLEGQDSQARLEGHLKSEDFFEVEKYPTATFEIAEVTAVDTIGGASHLVIGNLTLKGVTKSVRIPASLRPAGDSFLATTLPFDINRTEWGVNYGSGLLGTIQDEIISDMISLTIRIKADVPQK
jgi:polyisoprenoid-binding protein YceI